METDHAWIGWAANDNIAASAVWVKLGETLSPVAYRTRLFERVLDLLERCPANDARNVVEMYFGVETPDSLTAANVFAVMASMGILPQLDKPSVISQGNPEACRLLEDESVDSPLDSLERFLDSATARG